MASGKRAPALSSDDLRLLLNNCDDDDCDNDSGSDFCDSGSDSEDSGDLSNESDDENIDVSSRPTSDTGATMTWNWSRVADNFSRTRVPFTGDSRPQKQVGGVLESFQAFFDDELLDLMVIETNRYAEQYIASSILKSRSRVRHWKPVKKDELCVALGLTMLMGIVQKPTIKSYFSRSPLLETPIFPATMTQDRYELIMKFLHFTDNSKENEFEGSPKLFRIFPVIQHLNRNFSSAYLLEENISIDESLTLWKGRLSFKQYIPLKAAKFGLKSYELCDSRTGYLWTFFIYVGEGTDLSSTFSITVTAKTAQIVMKLCEPLLNEGRILWMDNFYNSPDLALLLKNQGTNVAGTLRLNRKNVPVEVKKKKLKKGEYIASQSNGILVMKWKDKKDVAMISNFHNANMLTVTKRNIEIQKPACVLEYNKSMGGVDLKDQKLQPYLIERKRGTKWYMKLFKRLLNVSVHNALVLYNSTNDPKLSHLSFRLALIQELIEQFGTGVEHPRVGRPSLSPSPLRLTERHFPDKIPPTGSKAKPQRRCAVCSTQGRRKETTFWCPDCKAGLCFPDCFKIYHTKLNF